MNRRERLLATLQGKPVDRPPVSFYEIDGFLQDPDDLSPMNNYSGPTWRPLLQLARERTDVIINTAVGADIPDSIGVTNAAPNALAEFTKTEQWSDENGSRFDKLTLNTPSGRALTTITRRDPGINTIWTIEHLLKGEDDLKAWLELPETETDYRIDTSLVCGMEERLGDAGIVMPNAADPVGCVASLFDMGTWTIMALMEPVLMRQAMERFHKHMLALLEVAGKALPGRLWRIIGPEYAAEPYLRPKLFHEYVTGYVTEMVEVIHRYGGYARIHSHGRLKNILDEIVATGCDGLDPIEPPRWGDVELSYVRDRYGDQLTLFGNIEITDLENLPTPQFEQKVAAALEQGPGRRGFVLMPSASPYGREVTPLCMRNYERMVEMVGG